MRARIAGAAALAVAAVATLGGCVLAPPAPAAAPAPVETATPAPEPPATEAPSPSASPDADGVEGMPVLDAHGCSQPLIEALLDTSATLHVREGFLRPEVLEGTEIACALTRPAEEGEDFAVHSIAVVAAGEDVLDTVDAALLATGLQPNPFVWGIYETGDRTPVAFLDPMPEWSEAIAELPEAPEGAEDWVVVTWYEPRG